MTYCSRQKNSMSSFVPPSPRSFHFSASKNRSTFYWGGRIFDVPKNKYVPVVDLEYLYELEVVGGKWKKHLLKGQHPPGVYHGACAVVGDILCFYGGFDKEGELTGSLFELNLSTKSWRELSRPGTGGPKKKQSCGMVAYNSTLIIHGGLTRDGSTNELHVFDLEAGTWSSPHVTGDVPPPDFGFTFTKVSNHQVVLHGGLKNKGTYVLDLSRMHWEKYLSRPEVIKGAYSVAICLGLGSDHAQLLLDPFKHTSPCLLDVATGKFMEIKLPHNVVIPFGSSATAIQTSPTSVEVVVHGEDLFRLSFRKQPSAPEGVSPVQWWIFTEYTSVFFEVDDMPTDPQTSSKAPENTRDNVDECQGVSANTPGTISTSSSEMQSEKTSKETDEIVVLSENIGQKRHAEQSEAIGCSKYLRIEDSKSDTEGVKSADVPKVVTVKEDFKAKMLNLLNVQKALKNVPSDKYAHVGLALGVEYNEIKKIEANFPRDVGRVWIEIIQCWLDSSPSHTWTSLALTLIENEFDYFTETFAVVY